MAIVSVVETHQNRDGERTIEGGRLRRAFIVRTSAVGDSLVTVLNASGIPALYSTYTNGTESAANWILKRKTPRQDSNSPLVWFVECDYEPRTSADDEEANPVQRPPKLSWRTVQESREMLVDAYDRKAQNTAGDPFDSPVEADKSSRVLILTRNESSFSQTAADEYVNTLNQSPIFDYAAKEGRMISIDGETEFDPDFGEYFSVTYEIHFRKTSVWVPTIAAAKLIPSGVTLGPWDTTRRNIGTREKKSDTGDELHVTVDDNGLFIPEGVDLDASAIRVTAGSDPFYIVLRPYLPKNWSPLALT